ncbi:hypothetical protein VHUM_03208 [Vanrija humicola]|uniref:Uncharacterized protein n=1 Tax=Vanrija humicola TaxID=5417 RepID=A0A7D8ZKK0_VANHU|nr:hypothetical protein VHUM_03208 [Vanrija humicola]
MNAPSILQGLMGSFKVLADSNRRQAELVKNLIDSIHGRGPPTIDPGLSIAYVPRSEYDALKARYDALVSTSAPISGHGAGSSRRARNARQHSALADGEDKLREAGSTTPVYEEDKRLGRKRRSMKLEHLVHKMANRRLGVEYPVSSFEVKGSRDLPDPTNIPPTAETSVNGVDEFRPDFRADVGSASVRPFVDAVIQDVKAAWNESYSVEEPEVDGEQIVKAVQTYWTRLSKRFDEQLTRERGESLVARRAAAFDSSPLNLCRLRALYRTLLTIDFAAMTNERADPKRTYTEDEWNAYRKQQCGARAAEAHEVVDQFWLSSTARSLLTILDVYASDQSARLRRKGRPKQPAPTFHLPPELWDRTNLPLLRPKDAQGLPVAGVGGIILFKFHVDEKVQQDFPDWAQGLYDNPPVAEEDNLLSNLPDVMSANAFYHLKPKVKQMSDAAKVTRLSPEEVQAILARPDMDHQPPLLDETGAAVAAATAAANADPDTSFDLTTDFMSARGLESIVALASGQLLNPFVAPTAAHASTSAAATLAHAHAANPLAALGGLGDVTGSPVVHGPSAGSSVRARKQAKRMMSEVPGGAATPVPRKRRREGDIDPSESVDMSGDASFLETL